MTKGKQPNCVNGLSISHLFQHSSKTRRYPNRAADSILVGWSLPHCEIALTLSEFELGLEMDSVEVRGILIFNNQEWGR